MSATHYRGMKGWMDAEAKARKWALIAFGVALVILAGTLFVASFDMKGDRQPLNEMAGDLSIEQLEDAVKADPEDGAAWARLGMALFERDDYARAVPALERAVALQPGKAGLLSLLGEAHFKAAGAASMPPAALAAFRKALEIDPGEPASRYYMAVAKDLTGDHEGAITDWLALLEDTPPGSPWEDDLRQTITQVGRINKIETASRIARLNRLAPPASPMPPTAVAGLPGPNAQQIRDAAKLSPSQQMDMGRGMVASLEAKLKANPGNVPGWIMLMRSRMTLKEPALAKAALRDAIAANPGARAQLEAEAKALGVPR